MRSGLFITVLVAFLAITGYAQTPTVLQGGVLNGASFDHAQPVAPGSLVSIFGSSLASSLGLAGSIPLSNDLANVSVTFNGIPAPLLAVVPLAFGSTDQINAQLPWELAGSTTASVVVTNANGVPSPPVTVSLASAAPGVFILQPSGYAVAYSHSDGQIAAPAGAIAGLSTHPAKIGDPNTLEILATGLGPVNPPVQTGNNVLQDAQNGILHNTATTPIVMIGGVQAQVFFSGMSPQFVGVYQLNVIVQPGTPTGNSIPLQIQMNGITSDPGNIAVSQ